VQERPQEYHTDDEGNLQAAQERLEERRAQQGIGAVVPLRNRAVGAPGEPQTPEQANVAQEAEDEANWPFVPPGEYSVAFVSETRFFHPVWKRVVWNISMKIIDEGEHFGTVVPYYLNAIPKGGRPRSGRYITSAFLVATEIRPPKDFWRRRPSSFMEGCVFRARVRTSKKDSHGVELPEAGHKSKVECLLKRIAGTPPCLRADKP
jgi:hypothetical protein